MKQFPTSTRTFRKFLLAFCFFPVFSQAQAYTDCGVTKPQYPVTAPTSDPCQQFLKDFIPTATDSVLEVRVKMRIYLPSVGNGNWGNNVESDFDSLLRIANYYFANVLTPNLPVSGVNNISHARIKFVKGGFTKITNQAAYNRIDSIAYNYSDDSAITVICGRCFPGGNGPNPSMICGLRVPDPWPNKVIMYPKDTINSIIDNDIHNRMDNAFIHELGHALGLYHPIPDEGFSGIKKSWGCCTDSIFSSDYVLEGPSVVNSAQKQCGDTTGNASNNITGSNPQCVGYISPHQMAIMHYQLRTQMRGVLTSNSYANHISKNSSSNYLVSADETWTVDRYMKGDITVQSGKKLEIQCTLGMTKNAYIIVEKNAQLIVNGGHITNISGQLWGGIIVAGTSSLGQVVNNTTGFATDHGVARIINGGKVSQAENALKNYVTDSYGNIDWGKRGGVIIGDGGVFENNIRDVEFISYQSPYGNDRSYFTNCTFRTDSTFNSVGPPYAHVSMWNTRGIQFKGCTFEHLAGDKFGYDHGRGIHSIDAIYSVDKNGTTPSKFNYLSWGILAGNTNPLKVVNIQNSNFTNCEMDAVYLKNMNNSLFINNVINLPYYYSTNGLYLHTCKNYQIKNSQFLEDSTQIFKASVGIYVYNSQAGAHQIYNNLFSNLEQGISAMANNSGVSNTSDGLKMNCNDFVSATSNKYDITMLDLFSEVSGSVPATVMRIQGAISNPNAYTLVRNKYGANTACSVCENRWYIQGTAAKQVHHGSNHVNNVNMHPTPQPQFSDVAVNDVPSNIQYNSNHCPVNPGVNGGATSSSAKLESLNSYLAYLGDNNDIENSFGFDIQATLAEKLNYFVSDTLPESIDSVIALIENNSTHFVDSDLLLIYAYMNKGNYTEALALTEELGAERTAWKDLITSLIDVYTDENGIYSLATNTTNSTFFNSYAENDTIDGQAAAQSLLGFVLHSQFWEPRLHPTDVGEGERKIALNKNLVILDNPFIKIYPNPSYNEVFLDHTFEKDHQLYVEVRDLSGRVIFTKSVKGSGTEYLTIRELSNGVYVFVIRDEKNELLFQGKLVKQE